jgi:hypothetical protein
MNRLDELTAKGERLELSIHEIIELINLELARVQANK